MATLFDIKTRERLSAARMGERSYTFIDESAWPACETFRTLANGWVSGFPPGEQAEIVAAIKGGDDQVFFARMLEVIVAAMLRGLGFGFESHPNLPNARTKLDFRFFQGDPAATAGFVEVTTAGPSEASRAAGNRGIQVYNAIDAVRMPPGYVLGYSLLKSGKDSPSLSVIRREVERWVNESSRAAIDGRSVEIFSYSDWSFELTLLAVGNSKQYENAIYLSSGNGGFSEAPSTLRSRLEAKSRRYGCLEHPYILVVGDTLGKTWGAESIAAALSEAIFGDEVVRLAPGAEPRLERAKNGFWLGPKGPRNRHVSGVLFFPDVGMWGLRNELHKPLLAVNPWAMKAIPNEFHRLKRIVAEDEHWKVVDGLEVADAIGLPQDWPPPKR